ncbi:endo-1,4-beta-xylanase [Roseomonas populi]|uniref:Beta-xylanase n=1 Tax=Roseomonas populi TaxID=3121582 RepID=A0ABT1X3F8_9PROT|nr:endo-1,4-beta-xylanase [Roseomonas pecuniae]MCR0982321.1 endo-1,4-beta-xylanase [Roseomonas pecuniae]
MIPSLLRRRPAGGPTPAGIARRAVLASLPPLLAPLSGMAAEDGLLSLAKARGLNFGCMITRPYLEQTPELLPPLRADAGFLAPGFELKWSRLQPASGGFEFRDADFLFDLSAREGFGKVRGHTLVWHEALPRWFDPNAGASEMRRTLALHIRTVAGRYAGRVSSWDVVNEPIFEWHRRPDGLRASPFLRALGPDYIAMALEMAAEADPAARLVINEYDLELDSPDQAFRRRAMLELLNGLVQRRAPVHALGIQAHIAPRSAPLNPELLRRFIRDVASLGLKVEITELDMVDRLLPADPALRDAENAAMNRDFLRAILPERAVDTVVLWGLSDLHNWQDHSSSARRKDGLPARTNAYDRDMRRKPDWYAIRDALRDAPRPG